MSSASAPPDSAAPSPPPSQQQQKQRLPPEVDLTFFSWSNLFRCLAGNCTAEEREKYLTARDVVREEADCKRCEAWRDWNFAYSPTVRFMRDQINTVGPDLAPKHVKCMRCPFDRKGGFNLDHGILLCANHLTSKKRLEDTLAHEMVHAYDYLRWDVNPSNMKHQACTEIRASMLSGECRFIEEWLHRKQYTLTGKDGMGQFQECVRRRATLSLMGRRECTGKEHAESVVRDVWGSCFADTRPFDEIYR